MYDIIHEQENNIYYKKITFKSNIFTLTHRYSNHKMSCNMVLTNLIIISETI